MSELGMANFVSSPAAQLVIAHHIHQTGINADSAVGRGEGVHLWRQLGFAVERETTFMGELGRQGHQALGVFVARRGQLCDASRCTIIWREPSMTSFSLRVAALATAAMAPSEPSPPNTPCALAIGA